jgi:transposase-like protein
VERSLDFSTQFLQDIFVRTPEELTELCPNQRPGSKRRHRWVYNGWRGGVRRRKCKTCGKQWSLRCGTVYSRRRKANENKIIMALCLRRIGAPIEGIALLLKVKPDTIRAWLRQAESVAKAAQSRGIRDPGIGDPTINNEQARALREMKLKVEAKFPGEIVVDLFDQSGHLNSDRDVWRLRARESPAELRREVRSILKPLKVKFTISRSGRIRVN